MKEYKYYSFNETSFIELKISCFSFLKFRFFFYNLIISIYFNW